MTISGSTWSKKLSFSLIVLACGTALAWNNTISGDDWIGLTKAVTVFYVGSQAVVDIVRPKKAPDGVNSA